MILELWRESLRLEKVLRVAGIDDSRPRIIVNWYSLGGGKIRLPLALLRNESNMERTPVDSASIEAVGFESSSSTLEVLFRDGRVYQYFDVPERVYDELLQSPSVGQYFHREIRGVYRFARV